jgi:outer membrane protein insertion porin family
MKQLMMIDSNLNFKINSSELFTVNRINIFGNNVTQESVIRNELLLDEGDPFNEILLTKSINNIKSLNFFRNVSAEIIDLDNNQKNINLDVQEKPTGEIALGAGAGTSGATIAFGIKENNFLGRGIGLDTSLTLTEKTIRGKFSVLNPNFRNTDKDLRLSIQAIETDRSAAFGYKSNKLGFSTGTSFEYLEDLNLGIDIENFYEKISTDSTASNLQKTQEGNYWDTFLNFDFDLDKRNQKYDTNDGYRAFYSIQLPIVSDTNTLINSLNYKTYTELYENNITSASIMLKSANSISNDNIKLSERLFIPSNRLRGFESGKIGPKDGNDYIGGNFVVSANFSSTIPQILPNYENINFLLFLDAANIWGVDYSSSIDDNGTIRSAFGIGIDWFTPIGPLNFSFSHPISKKDSDVTETFRFNLGTTF